MSVIQFPANRANAARINAHTVAASLTSPSKWVVLSNPSYALPGDDTDGVKTLIWGIGESIEDAIADGDNLIRLDGIGGILDQVGMKVLPATEALYNRILEDGGDIQFVVNGQVVDLPEEN